MTQNFQQKKLKNSTTQNIKRGKWRGFVCMDTVLLYHSDPTGFISFPAVKARLHPWLWVGHQNIKREGDDQQNQENRETKTKKNQRRKNEERREKTWRTLHKRDFLRTMNQWAIQKRMFQLCSICTRPMSDFPNVCYKEPLIQMPGINWCNSLFNI